MPSNLNYCLYFLLVLNGTYNFLSVAGIPTLQKSNEPFKTSEAFSVPVICSFTCTVSISPEVREVATCKISLREAQDS